jgi:hypothetical protein
MPRSGRTTMRKRQNPRGHPARGRPVVPVGGVLGDREQAGRLVSARPCKIPPARRLRCRPAGRSIRTPPRSVPSASRRAPSSSRSPRKQLPTTPHSRPASRCSRSSSSTTREERCVHLRPVQRRGRPARAGRHQPRLVFLRCLPDHRPRERGIAACVRVRVRLRLGGRVVQAGFRVDHRDKIADRQLARRPGPAIRATGR